VRVADHAEALVDPECQVESADGRSGITARARGPQTHGAPSQSLSSRVIPRAAFLGPIVRPRHLHSPAGRAHPFTFQARRTSTAAKARQCFVLASEDLAATSDTAAGRVAAPRSVGGVTGVYALGEEGDLAREPVQRREGAV
jgi:hypothetical protein